MTRSLAGHVEVLDDRHSSAATMRPMALVRAKLGLVVPVGKCGGAGSGAVVSACMRPLWGRGLGPLVIRSGSAA